jgi:MFS transporter, DHA2 family, multidrug resistance protein
LSPSRPERQINPYLISVIVMLAMIMGIIDASIVNVAIPHMMGTLSASQAQISWVVTSYLLANVIVIPLSAWLVSLVGRTRLYRIAVATFTVASALCAFAPSLTLLVAARVLQGIAAGIMMPTGQAILLEAFPPEKRGSSMAVFALGIILGPTIAPTLGGWIVDNYGWPWVFYINVPIGLVSVLLVSLFLRDPAYLHRRKAGQADLLGVILLSSSIGIGQYILEKGAEDGWFEANWVVVATAVSLVLLVAFVAVELENPDPAVDLRIFADRNFSSVSVVNTVMGVGLMGSMFMLPMFLQQLIGFSATQSGLVLMPGALATAVASPICGQLSNKGDPRLLSGFGMLMFALAMFMMSRLNGNADQASLLWPQIIRGVGMGFVMIPFTVAAMARIPRERMGQATGLFNLCRSIGGSMGIAWLSNIFTKYRAVHLTNLVGYVDPTSPIVKGQLQGVSAGLLARGLDMTQATGVSLLSLYGRVARSATELAFRDMFLTLVLLFLSSLPFLALVQRVRSNGTAGRKPAGAMH